jgi:BirA family biotin operon repressor/biotin-[acetyl-CoA-carboxylase] ligase
MIWFRPETTMMDQCILAERLSGLPLADIRYFESLGSTNDTAAAWALQGAADVSLVIADQQTKGRGRAGRQWFTYPGSALAFSLVLRPSSQEYQGLAGLIPRFTGLGALAVSQALQTQFGLQAEIKWPNDVLVRDRKLCGVLAEAHWMGDRLAVVILGIGINIAAQAIPPKESLHFPATSLETELGFEVDRITILRAVLVEITRWRAELMDEKFLQSWEANLAYQGDWVQLVSPAPAEGRDSVLVTGQIIGLAPDGALQLRTRSGEELAFRSGEISKPQENFQLRLVDSSPK